MSAVLSEPRAIDDLRFYLRAWRRWVRGWRAPLGAPRAVPFLHEMRPTVCGWGDDDSVDEVSVFVLRAIDAEVECLPLDQRAALRLTYLNEIAPAVFRSARMTMELTRRLCAQAELEMVPRVRARGVVLGGA